jgi:hypothetical protein
MAGSAGSHDGNGRVKRVHLIERERVRGLSGPRVLRRCMTEGTRVSHAGGATQPDKPAIDLGKSFHVPFVYRLPSVDRRYRRPRSHCPILKCRRGGASSRMLYRLAYMR